MKHGTEDRRCLKKNLPQIKVQKIQISTSEFLLRMFPNQIDDFIFNIYSNFTKKISYNAQIKKGVKSLKEIELK